MQSQHPLEYAARAADKLNYRYPGVGGESYLDVVLRMQESILLLEQLRDDITVVCDRAVYRTIVAYFTSVSITELPYHDVQPGVLELRRTHSGFEIEHFAVAAGAVTTAAGPGTKATHQNNSLTSLAPGSYAGDLDCAAGTHSVNY